jgi:hypothetical protein
LRNRLTRRPVELAVIKIGISYLSSLTVSADSEIRAPRGMAVSMTVDGVRTTIAGGRTYTGAITVSVS